MTESMLRWWPGLATLVCVCATPANAQDLATDRPDFTESAVVIPTHSIQVEGGFTWEQSSSDVRALAGPELLIRWGLTPRIELRLGFPGYLALRNHTDLDGFVDSSLGTKLQIVTDAKGWDVAGIVAVSLPTGAESLTSDGWDPGLTVTAAREIWTMWSLGTQLTVESTTEGQHRATNWTGTAVLGTSLGSAEVVGLFVELAASVPQYGSSAITFHHGYTWLVRPLFQLDIHAGVGLNDAAPNWLIGAGFGFRWD